MNLPTKEVQGRFWSTSPAHWVKYQEPSFIPMYQYVLDQVQLNEENMLLDAGCGSGLFLSMVSATGAQVHGIDAAPGLLSVAKGRAPGASLLIEDLESLPFIDYTFDVVTAFNAFQYAGSLQKALAEARRVVKRHGTIAIGTWGQEEKCPSASILKAVAALVGPSPFSSTGMFVLTEEDKVELTCKANGLKLRSKNTVSCPLSFNSDAELLDGFLCMAPCASAVESVGEDAVRRVILESAQVYNLADSVYYLNNHFTVFITEKI